MDRFVTAQGVRVPAFFYGTAWKEERTEALARLALDVGFTAIDTANQRRHYVEQAVGDALRGFFSTKKVTREDLFIQTKFTFADGQDHRLPYDKDAPIGVQVAQSFASSLDHLGVTFLDALILHGPAKRDVITQADLEAWRAMEALAQSGQVRLLGVSNVNLRQLTDLHNQATVKPAIAQIRTFASRRWFKPFREFCASNGIVYQAFSLLTANAKALAVPAVNDILQRTGKSLAEVVFRFAIQSGMVPLTGSSNEAHLRADLACFDFELDEADVRTIGAIAG